MTPIYAALLGAEGISTLDDLADATTERIARALDRAGVRPIGTDLAREWIDAARRATS
jgi:hypothetical protein